MTQFERIASVLALWFIASIASPTVNPVFGQVDTGLGVTVDIPDTWEMNPPVYTSRAEFARMANIDLENATADTSDVVSGVIQYIAVEVDSTLLPTLDAFDSHFLLIEMHGYYDMQGIGGWYNRWLRSQGKKSLFERYPTFQDTDAPYLVRTERVLADDDPRKIFKDAYAVTYESRRDSSVVGTRGQIYWMERGGRAYKIIIDGRDIYFEDNWPLYERVLRSLTFEE